MWGQFVATERIESPPLPRCPRCGRYEVRPSLQRHAMDTVMGLFSRKPFRCRFCSRRFYEYRNTNGSNGSETKN